MLNPLKLENVVRKTGKLQARCPACKEQGSDSQGVHLVVYPDGRFNCIKYPGDRAHNRRIVALTGTGETGLRTIKVPVKPKIRQPPRVIKDLGLFGPDF